MPDIQHRVGIRSSGDHSSTKWALYLMSLKSPCETGTGNPFPKDIDIG